MPAASMRARTSSCFSLVARKAQWFTHTGSPTPSDTSVT